MKGKRKLHPAQRKKDKVAVAQWQQFKEQQVEQQRSGGPIAEKPNEQLFYIDKHEPTPSENRKLKWKNKPTYADAFFSGNPNVKPAVVQKDVTQQKKIIAEIAKKKQKISLEGSKPISETGPLPQLYDLWGESSLNSNTKKATTPKLPAPGESYHPKAEDHQDLLGEAVAIAIDQEEKYQTDLMS
jgi:hypothetical protein